jgi:hypothetical protein
MISSLNFLHNTKKPGNANNSSSSLPLATQRALGHLGNSASVYVRGLTDPSVQCFDTSFKDYQSAAAASYATETESLHVVADAVSLPRDTSSVPLLDVLPPPLAAAYSRPSPSLFRPPTLPPVRRYAKLCGTRSNYAKFVRRLVQAQMVDFTTKPLCVNGLFAVVKPDGSQRFIVDCRPANSIFTDSPEMDLPTPDVLSKLELPPDVPVFSAKADLDNCFHRFKVPEWLRSYLCLPPVRAADVDLGSVYGDDTLVYPRCTTLPMGWSHSAALVQAANEHCISSLPCFSRDDLINRQNDFRLDRPRFFVYIDDFVVLGTNFQRLDVLLDKYILKMESLGHLVKPSKVVRPTSSGMEMLGLYFDGNKHTLGIHPRKLASLVERTRALVAKSRCTGKDLSRLVGSWTWAVLVRRLRLQLGLPLY